VFSCHDFTLYLAHRLPLLVRLIHVAEYLGIPRYLTFFRYLPRPVEKGKVPTYTWQRYEKVYLCRTLHSSMIRLARSLTTLALDSFNFSLIVSKMPFAEGWQGCEKLVIIVSRVIIGNVVFQIFAEVYLTAINNPKPELIHNHNRITLGVFCFFFLFLH
jgi:hypothetical protein